MVPFTLHQLFDDYEELQRLLQEHYGESYTLFSTRSSQLIDYNENPDVNPRLKYLFIDLRCKFCEAYRETQSSKESSTHKKGCEARMYFGLSKCKTALELKILNLVHTFHEVNKETYSSLPEVRRLSSGSQEYVKKLHKMGVDARSICKEIRNDRGKQIEPKDVYNILQKAKNPNRHDLDEARKFLQKQGYDVKILHSNNELVGLYFSSPVMRAMVDLWKEIIFIDATYKLLLNRLILIILSVQDSYGCTKIGAAVLVVNELTPTLTWIMRCFKEEHNDITIETNCFMSDKAPSVRKAIKDTFPGMRVLICRFHAKQAMDREVTTAKMLISNEDRENAKNLMFSMVDSYSEDEYTEHFIEFCTSAPKAVREYFLKNWHPVKEEWARYAMSSKGNLNNTTNNPTESTNGKIKLFCSKLSSLVEFLEKFVDYLEHQRRKFEVMTISLDKKVPSRPCADVDEESYREALTSRSFKQVSHEMSRITKFYNAEIDHRKQVGTFHSEYVSYSCTTSECKCGIRKGWALPCRHIFALRSKLGLTLFDINLCDERWTKAYCRKAYIVLKSAAQASNSPRLQIMSLKKDKSSSKQDETSLVLNSLIEDAATFTRLKFEKKRQVFVSLEKLWDDQFEIEVNDKRSKSTLVFQEYTFEQRRRLMLELKEQIMSKKSFNDAKLQLLKEINVHWRDGSDVTLIKAVHCQAEKKAVQCREKVEAPTPIKITGKPRGIKRTYV